jgi:hypothetical protein
VIVREDVGVHKKLDQLLGMVEGLSQRMARLESGVFRAIAVATSTGISRQCCRCGTVPSRQCTDCHLYYCDVCSVKQKEHSCVQEAQT